MTRFKGEILRTIKINGVLVYSKKKNTGKWTWVSERPLTIYKWGKGEPGGEHHAAFMYKRSSNGKRGVFGSVQDKSTEKKHAYICEISKGELIFCRCCCCF